MLKKGLHCLFFTKNVLPLSSLNASSCKASGTLDEWLSQWSAKPCTAVRIRQVPQRALKELFFCFYIFIFMADNFLEKRMEQYRAHSSASSNNKSKDSFATLLAKNRSTRGYDASYKVRIDQLRRIVAVNNKLASARNRQPLRFRLVTADEAQKVLPFIRMGAGLKELGLPLAGTEPNAFIVVCSTIEPRNSTYVDLGISVQSMLLQAVEMGLNGLCIMDFDCDRLAGLLQLQYRPLLVVAIGKSAEKIRLVDIKENDDHSYYRENGVHYVPKVVVEDLIIE